MVVLPRRGARATDTVEALVRRRPALVRVNGIVLAVCAVTLALAPLAGGARAMSLDLGPGNEFDPSASAGALAYTQRAKGVSQVVVRLGGATEQYAGQEPALDGDLLAYRDAAGVHVVRWSTREEIALIAGASHPALVWPWLAFRRERGDGGSEIWLRHLVKGTVRRIALAGPTLDLGRPTIGGGRVGWQVVGPKGTRIGLERISDRRRTIAVRTKIGFLAHPSLSGTRLLWVEHRPGGSSLKVRVLGKTATRTLVRTDSRTRVIWTTSLSGRTAFFTRWFSGKGIARIERVRF